MSAPEGPPLLTTAEVAAMFGVDAKTVARYGTQGRLLRAGSPGAHSRYFAVEVHALRAGVKPEVARALAEAVRDDLAKSRRSEPGRDEMAGGASP